MILWWERSTGRPADKRSMMDMPAATVMLHFYRSCADKLRALDDQTTHTGDELHEIDRLKKLLLPDVPESFLGGIEDAYAGVRVGSDDPVWDKWLAMNASGHIPDSWWGPLLKNPHMRFDDADSGDNAQLQAGSPWPSRRAAGA